MNYASVLYRKEPIEKGDFFLLYKVNGLHYIIYRPEQFRISCIEMSTFQDISAELLAVYINGNKKVIERNEAVLDHREFEIAKECKKSDLLAYRFDIEDGKFNTDTHEYSCHIAKDSGFMLYTYKNEYVKTTKNIEQNVSLYNDSTNVERKEIVTNKWVEVPHTRNIFSNGEGRLIFDSTNCYCKYEKNGADSKDVYLCFNPVDYKKSIDNPDRHGTIYLLCNGNPHTLSRIIQNDTNVAMIAPTNSAGGGNITFLEAIIYTANKKYGKVLFELYRTDSEITLLTHKCEQFDTDKIIALSMEIENHIKEEAPKIPTQIQIDELPESDITTMMFRNCEAIIASVIKSIQSKIDAINFV